MIKIYLDTCAIQRPLDSKTQIRIILEAEAVLGVLALCEAGTIELVASDASTFEIERTPNIARQEYAWEVLSKANIHVRLNTRLEKRARALNVLGIKPLDALHLAAAEQAGADYFCTCDDRFLRRARTVADLKTRVVGPVELIGELEK
jgi:predicted nucleic acid-binding protein